MESPPLYTLGTKLYMRSHRPPEPFGKTGYKHVKTPGVPDISPDTVGHLNPTDLIYALHPRERYEPPIMPMPAWFIDDQRTMIKVVGQLSTNRLGGGGAQVVLCEVLQAPDVLWKKMGYKTHELPRKVVAKIFDPLHYHGYVDPVAEADREYAQEAAAYMHLHGKRDTKTYTDKPDLVPRFYGMWTTDITSDHFRKNVMSSTAMKQKLKAEAKKRKRFDDAAAAAKNGDPSQQPKLVAHSFRPIRVILTQHVDGSPMWQHLIMAVDDTKNPIVKPREKFNQEEVRLDIFGNMLDTISRVEHLGVKLPTITARAPAVFLITEKTNTIEPEDNIVTAEASKGKEREIVNVDNPVKYGVVMTDFTQADVACYTDIGYDLDEKLPLPSHPLSSYEIDEYLCLRGWYPPEWMTDVDKYHEWGESHFKTSDYADPETMQRVIKEVGWYEDLKKFGREPPDQDDPKWQEYLKTLWADAPDTWKNFTLPTAEEYQQRREASKETLRSLREKEEAEDLKTRILDFHRIKKSRALEEHKKKFGQRPSGPNDPEWRRIVDVEYANAPESWMGGKNYKVPGKKPSGQKKAMESGKSDPEVERLRLGLQDITVTDTLPPDPEEESSPITPRQSSFGRTLLADLTMTAPTFQAEQPQTPTTPRPHQTQRTQQQPMGDDIHTSDDNQTSDEGQTSSDSASGHETSPSRYSEGSEAHKKEGKQ